ncbi:MAG: hypothetical protein JM57_05470 [Comamonadaceae bacterium BICA1-1]|nr:MAG: hypothetical protein JM57_05470 [Comamonadaceae bacterium BICA1-1]
MHLMVNPVQGVAHYENFPVASWLCPPALRAPVRAIYAYARCADDIADEGTASPTQRLLDLQAYRAELLATCVLARTTPPAPAVPDAAPARWPHLMQPLAQQVHVWNLPLAPLLHLLDAFEQDVRRTASGEPYADLPELLDYCSRSANPIGRLLLHLYGVADEASLRQSDATCSALQLINFWQDLSLDLPRQRHYLPLAALQRHGVALASLQPNATVHPPAQAMLLELCAHARALMLQGAPLAWRLPGRVGWELRLVVQGGLRILDKIEALNGRTWCQRPRLRATDAPLLLWRSLWPPAAAQPSPSVPHQENAP